MAPSLPPFLIDSDNHNRILESLYQLPSSGARALAFPAIEFTDREQDCRHYRADDRKTGIGGRFTGPGHAIAVEDLSRRRPAMNAERFERLRKLITLGRERGYVLEADLGTELTPIGVSEDQLADIAATFADMGIPVFSEPSSADALAAARESIEASNLERATNQSTVATAELDTGSPVGDPFVVVHVGAEGGDLRLIAQKTEHGHRFRTSMFDQTLMWIDESERPSTRQSHWVTSWDAAMTLMDKYPWAILHPHSVHPEFRGRVLAAATERLTKTGGPSDDRLRQRLRSWEAIDR